MPALSGLQQARPLYRFSQHRLYKKDIYNHLLPRCGNQSALNLYLPATGPTFAVCRFAAIPADHCKATSGFCIARMRTYRKNQVWRQQQ